MQRGKGTFGKSLLTESHWKKASGYAHKPVSGRSEPLLWLNLISKERSLSQSRVGALCLCLVGAG